MQPERLEIYLGCMDVGALRRGAGGKGVVEGDPKRRNMQCFKCGEKGLSKGDKKGRSNSLIL